MPCDDISEILNLRLDDDERLVTYGLEKRTCGAAIGERDLLLGWLGGRDADHIAALTGDDLHAAFDIAADEEFLYAKHLVSLQEGLAVLRGAAAGGPIDPCAVIEVAYDQGPELRAVIAVHALTEKIRACGSCGSCGSSKTKAARTSADR